MAPSSHSSATANGSCTVLISPSTGIEIGRKNFPDIDFFLADGQTLYADFLSTVGPVDVVISTEVIEHIYDPRSFLSNCYELLKPAGILVIATPYHGYVKNVLLAVSGKTHPHFTVLWDHGPHQILVTRYPRQDTHRDRLHQRSVRRRRPHPLGLESMALQATKHV
jgi:SAM-dependent methyltransferase